MIALLAGILALVVLGQAATAIVRALPPRIQYVGVETVYHQGRPVEWRVKLRVREEDLVASFWSEREQIRLADELGVRE